MATLTLTATFDGLWPADSLAGGVISSRLANKMVYVSDLGFTVTIRGTGLVYDADGLPSGGTVTGITIAKGAVTYANLTGISTDFARTGMQIFGFTDPWGNDRGPDPYALVQNALRGNDLITGSSGWDDIRAGIGNDTINAGAGDDYVGDEGGNDSMDGGDGWDVLSYDEANWRWESYRGVNLDVQTGVAIDPFGNTDHFQNFEGYKDTLYSDTLRGGAGDDEFYINRGNDRIDGRGGFDWANYLDADHWGAKRGISVDLSTGLVRDSWRGNDTLAGIEAVRGTVFGDSLMGSAAGDTFLGGRGLDSLNGGAGVDVLGFWTVGKDGETGHGITVNLSLATEVLDDGYGNTENADNFETVDASDFADNVTGNGLNNNLWGNAGNDTIQGEGGNDDLGGGWGRDQVGGGSGNDSIGGGGDNDTLTGNSGVDQFYFGWDLADVGIDRITDFAAGETIWVGSWWGGGFTTETLVANQFRSGAGVATANSASQRFLYNTTTGDLYFDADGSGGAFTATRFATLGNQAALTFNDIHILF